MNALWQHNNPSNSSRLGALEAAVMVPRAPRSIRRVRADGLVSTFWDLGICDNTAGAAWGQAVHRHERSMAGGRLGRKCPALLRETRTVKVLLLDDLGDEKYTEAVTAELKDLIEYRTSRALPLLWTSNLRRIKSRLSTRNVARRSCGGCRSLPGRGRGVEEDQWSMPSLYISEGTCGFAQLRVPLQSRVATCCR